MWQSANITSQINASIDNQTVWFSLSAWIGGYANQDDNAVISLTFLNFINEQVGMNISLGPVWASDRGSISSLLFRQTNGIVPVGTRSFLITVTITRFAGIYNDGSVDNIILYFYSSNQI